MPQRTTISELLSRSETAPLACLTAYTAPVAALADPYIDMLLVGDSVGMVLHGLPSTLGVDMEMMIMHAKAVRRGSEQAMIVVDMPFASYEAGWEQAFTNAARLIKESDCQAIKLECGRFAAPAIARLVERGIPVLAHTGLRPQSVLLEGHYRKRGRSDKERHRIMEEAKAAENAGAFAIVIENVPDDLAAEITSTSKVPTIGIGAGAACNGQILVIDDMIGMFETVPGFVRRYGEVGQAIKHAVRHFAADVRAREFPASSVLAEKHNI